MSLNFSVYVGPYLVAYGTKGQVERDILEQFDDVLIDGRWEAGCDDDRLYVIPNDERIYRETTWDRSNSDSIPCNVTPHQIMREMRQMTDVAEKFIAAIEAAGGTCNIQWGVVCCES